MNFLYFLLYDVGAQDSDVIYRSNYLIIELKHCKTFWSPIEKEKRHIPSHKYHIFSLYDFGAQDNGGAYGSNYLIIEFKNYKILLRRIEKKERYFHTNTINLS